MMSTLPHQVALVSDTPSVSFSDVSAVAAALQKQATRDFGPLWQVSADSERVRRFGIGSGGLLAGDHSR